MTTSFLNMPLAISLELIIIAGTNKPICKICDISKQTRLLGYKLMTLTSKLLQRADTDLWGPYDLAFMGDN